MLLCARRIVPNAATFSGLIILQKMCTGLRKCLRINAKHGVLVEMAAVQSMAIQTNNTRCRVNYGTIEPFKRLQWVVDNKRLLKASDCWGIRISRKIHGVFDQA